jgi:iron complex outermembrane receptor protein
MVNRSILVNSLRSALLGGVCVGAFAATSVSAQQNSDAIEEVVVSGIRGALQRDLDIKRDADGLVDAISATDIGKFPDSDLAAAMQRIPGVSISRGTSSAGGVPTTTGDATEITVRGFGPIFNQTLFDGREISTGTKNRAFDFSTLTADFVKEVDILKSPDASLSSGTIGATINVIYPKPFDHPGLQAAASYSGSYAPEASVAPTSSATLLVSDTFNDKFGILADAAFSDHRTQANHVNTQGWEGTLLSPSQLSGAAANASTAGSLKSWFIQDYGIYQEQDQERRVNGRLALQWKPADSVMVTLDDNYSRDQLRQVQYGYSVWFNGGSLTNVQRDNNGTVLNFVQPNTPTDFQSQINGQLFENNDIGLNVKWDVTKKLQVEADADRAQSWLNPGGQLTSIDMDVGYGPSAPGGTNGSNIGVMVNGATGLPVVTGYGPNGNAGAFINNGLIGSHVLPISSQQNLDTVNQAKLQGTWSEEHIKLKFGFQYVGNHDSLREEDTFANNNWQAYAGYGPASNNPGGVVLPQSWFTGSFSTSNFIPGWSGNLPANVLKFNALQVVNYLQSLGNPQTKSIAGYNTGDPAYAGMFNMAWNAGSYQDVIEDTLSGFLNANIQTEVGGRALLVNLGLREDSTRVKSYGIGQLPTNLTVQSSDHTAFIVGYGPQSLVESGNNYMYLLPNLDMNLSATDNINIRFDASRTLTRPDLAYLSPVLNITGTQRVGALVATGGNPQLNPYTSDNVDLSAEWYYQPNSYLSVDGFVKNVSNFIVGGANKQSINGVVDPTTGAPGQFTVSTNLNGPTAKVYGAEFALQHVFGESGWGFQANTTVVGTNKPYDPSNTSVTGFAVTGLANSANLVGFYDKYGFQARVALNWRAEYLDHFGQQQNNSAFGSEPTFVNASTQVDFSTSYDVTKQLSVYFEGFNLNDNVYSTHGRYSNQILDVIDYGRRFTLGLHAKL